MLALLLLVADPEEEEVGLEVGGEVVAWLGEAEEEREEGETNRPRLLRGAAEVAVDRSNEGVIAVVVILADIASLMLSSSNEDESWLTCSLSIDGLL